jgi:hypothetical protein
MLWGGDVFISGMVLIHGYGQVMLLNCALFHLLHHACAMHLLHGISGYFQFNENIGS